MSNEEFPMPRKFAFDEFYGILKEFVNDPEDREYLAVYDAEANAGRGQLDDSTASELAAESQEMFRVLSWRILQKYGYPSYYELIQSTKNNFKHRQNVLSFEGSFRGIAKRLIRKTDGYLRWLQEDVQDEDFDIDDKSSVLRLLKMWEEKKRQMGIEVPFILTGDDQ